MYPALPASTPPVATEDAVPPARMIPDSQTPTLANSSTATPDKARARVSTAVTRATSPGYAARPGRRISL